MTLLAPSRRALLAGAASALAMPAIGRAQSSPTTLEFYFPVAVGGPVTKIIDGYAQDFMKANPDVTVKPVYAGSYVDTLTKTATATKAGQGPQMAVLLAVDAFSLIDDGLIVPVDQIAPDKAMLAPFFPAFLRNSDIDGHQWGVPFQRSTVVMYWNKDAFRAEGMDPEHAPVNWTENTAMAIRLTKRDGDSVARWGIEIPGSGLTYWLWQGLAAAAGADLSNQAGTRVDFNSDAAVRAATYWRDLNTVHHATPPGIVEWGTAPRDFIEGRAGMIWTTTGNLTNIRTNAKFPFGVAMLPADVRRGSPTGGGNFYVMKSASPAQQQAAMRFLAWLTTPERAAQWSIDTGYVPVREDAFETDAMKAYLAKYPQAAVLRDQLRFAVPELSTHDNQRVSQTLNDALQAVLVGKKEPKPALDEAQAAATRLLRPFAT